MNARSDGDLLSEVVSDGSEAAFEELVRRHGSLVLNQCLRLLSDRQEAEDATQAVFLVLWKKANSLRKQSTVAAWLHRVTRNVCRNAQRSRSARKVNERKATEMNQRHVSETARWDEIKEVLDDELDRLPEKYRLPLILFHFEARQLDEIAELTSSNRATVGTRLSRGREMLRDRIARRGITIETASLFAVIGVHAGTAELSASLVSSTALSASLFGAGQVLSTGAMSAQSIHLAKGILHMLAVTNTKIVTASVAAAVMFGGVSVGVINAVLHVDSTQTDVSSAAERSPASQQRSLRKDQTDQPSLNRIITALEKKREQVKSLSLETKSYCTTFVAPEILHSWSRFRAADFSYEGESYFAYKGGLRYLHILHTRLRSSGDDRETGDRHVTYNGEKGSDGVRGWERRVDVNRGPAQVFVHSVRPGSQWITNPAYCSQFGWDCMTELHTYDESALKEHRTFDFLSLLKQGAFSIDPEISMLDGEKCVVLRRHYVTEVIELDRGNKERTVVKIPVTETIWLDVDHGYAMRLREHQNERWGLDRTVNSDFVEILPGIWFPKKTMTQPHAPPEAAQEYQGQPVLSWHYDLIRWSVNDVPDSRFDVVTRPGDRLYENGEKMKVINDDNQPVDPMSELTQ